MSGPHAWMPVSPCGPGCLPAAGGLPAVAWTRRLLRLLCAGAVLLAGLVLALALPLLAPVRRDRALRAWHRGLLRALRIQLRVIGDERFAAAGTGVLVVSNHTSWLDLIALGAVQPLRMVAKSEVRGWPVIGLLARRAGTIFLERERLTTLPRTVETVSAALTGGAAIGAFPEGTTWCGLAGGRFRPAVFQAALDSATPVRPVALRYRLPGAGATVATTVASFVGPTTLGEAVLRVAGVPGLVLEVHVLPLLSVTGTDRRALAGRAEAAVTAVSLPVLTQPADATTALRVG
ncbi:MAG TPA: lysophospholipid acyltransferase family protein [Pseudonocardiaceae bacterium]|jgi:1-acyl-sn-glycerol-3-phosphate acyltransferase